MEKRVLFRSAWLPYLLLAANPKWVDRMPRTGPASELVKQVMGIFMLAYALCSILVGHLAIRRIIQIKV